ncbi:MAG TPA: protein kinase [Pseudonocardia sp.]|nr:protein kinase [Pseudonocardia sp.]
MTATMFGPYRLDGLLGRGGMGEVHRAHDTEQDRAVALKLLPGELSGDEEYRARFRREARIASQLTDPHIVPIHRHGEIDGRLFLDMRLVDGEDLGAVLRADGALAPEAAVAVVEQVASALDAAHGAGLVHRDIKPSNVLLTRPARTGGARFAYLGDFGIARSVGNESQAALTRVGSTVGTMAYMAPERFLDRPLDARSDIYALACLLYECLTGAPPFPAGEAAALMHAHLSLHPPRPSAHPGVPPALDDVIARGMAKDPAHRYRTAGELAAAARVALTAVPSPGAWTVAPAQGAWTAAQSPGQPWPDPARTSDPGLPSPAAYGTAPYGGGRQHGAGPYGTGASPHPGPYGSAGYGTAAAGGWTRPPTGHPVPPAGPPQRATSSRAPLLIGLGVVALAVVVLVVVLVGGGSGGGSVAAATGSSAPGLAVPDNTPSGVSDTIVLSDAGTVSAVRVSVAITHPVTVDLRVELRAPNGAVAVLADRAAFRGPDYRLDLDSTTEPALAGLLGGRRDGAWELRVIDGLAADTGTLDSWSVTVTRSP